MRRLSFALPILVAIVVLSGVVALSTGYQSIAWADLRTDEMARTIFFRLRVPRVALGMMVGGSLAAVGAALQALFRNPLAEPFTLGVSGGGALGASIAIALGFGASVAGIPMVFVTAFLGAPFFIWLLRRDRSLLGA